MSVTVDYWSDPHCPYAYLTRARLRALESEYAGRVRFRSRALLIEVDTKRGTPKGILDAETPLILLDAPDVPFTPWGAVEDAWPTTLVPAMEAVKCAERQSVDAAWALDWEVRVAFFGRGEDVTQRHVLRALAERVDDLDVDAWQRDWDAGAGKKAALDETMDGWYARDYEVSPTLTLPDGSAFANPAGPKVELDEAQNWRVTAYRPSPPDAMDQLRALLDRALKQP